MLTSGIPQFVAPIRREMFFVYIVSPAQLKPNNVAILGSALAVGVDLPFSGISVDVKVSGNGDRGGFRDKGRR